MPTDEEVKALIHEAVMKSNLAMKKAREEMNIHPVLNPGVDDMWVGIKTAMAMMGRVSGMQVTDSMQCAAIALQLHLVAMEVILKELKDGGVT